jgi:hypothetical protein
VHVEAERLFEEPGDGRVDRRSIALADLETD